MKPFKRTLVILPLLFFGMRVHSADKNAGWRPLKIDHQVITDGGQKFDQPDAIHFKNGETFQTSVYAVRFIDVLEAPGRKPYLLFSGRSCNECDAGRTIYLHSPSDGPMKGEAEQARFSFPGQIFDYADNSLVFESRAFYGSCLESRPDGAVWFEKEYEGESVKDSVLFLEVGKDGKLTQSTLERNPPKIENTLRRVKDGICHEIPGERQQSEP